MDQSESDIGQMAVVCSPAFLPEMKVGVVIPQICTCCMKPTQNRRKLTKSSSRKYRSGNKIIRSSHQSSVDFFTCPECLKHEKALDSASASLFMRAMSISFAVIFLLLVTGSVLLRAFGLYPLTTTFLSSAVLTFLISITVTYAVLPFVEKTTRIPPIQAGHVSYDTSVHFSDWDAFTFQNVKYAQTFYALNRKNLERYPQLMEIMGITITLKSKCHITGPSLIPSWEYRFGYLLGIGTCSWLISTALFSFLTHYT